MKSFKLSLMIISILSFFVLAACGNNSSKQTNNEKETDNKTEETGYTVQHAMGETTIKETPKKVVILTNEGTEALLALGVTPVGAVQSWTGDPWYPHIADKMADVKVVGTESEVNVEAIAALKPDLIIGNKMRQEKIYDQLSAIAPTVFAETLRGNWQENFKLYAKALNKEAEGQKVIADYNQRIKDIKEKLGDKVNKEVSIVRFMAGDVRIYHKDTFSGVILDQIGFARPESQNVDDFAERNATKERIPAMDGDVLFYFTYETGDGEASSLEEEWIEDPLFKNLSVVKAGNIHKVDDVIWNTAGGVIAANLMLDDIEKYFIK
ncbi:ABC transporter substrate-binding protein [Bacillus sp. S/N-304-OC-R1]|uniref:ABC transporter substrate-binding protein n=1 Tax=Bacillus sp. S/N-304-OC-R1 TaxID=2758034 RepID=UPI001C8D05E3|nr:iron-siderophore ABC transporter substrate-binding protein [Bacillus sp. S/N-304-OC-R1]MBY0124187.1 iron-siderophore ABC transporter substrate-binding protein [Bacillus sp. S/N-304-OC-R1]